jgi:hypothetical protein
MKPAVKTGDREKSNELKIQRIGYLSLMVNEKLNGRPQGQEC